MNAMIQQFFMNPIFRYAILMADDKKSENLIFDPKKKIQIDDNLLHQFQKIFGFLELSDRQDYNPYEFCFSFKDFSGQPIDIMIQQDAQEFLNMIFDRLENALKPTPFKKILDSIYGGKTITQLICSNCNNVKSREEGFYNLTLEIKDLKNLNESFERFITGETISDYLCENCDKKVDTQKRCLLSDLPNIFIIGLQRIVFSLETYQNDKINSKLEFPHELDVTPFIINQNVEQSNSEKTDSSPTKSNKNPKSSNDKNPDNEYVLKGIVVHIGTATVGHYYSYINYKDKKWYEYNDSYIKDFDPKKIEAECFGQSESYTDNFSSVGVGSWDNRDSSKNAYILVYEKKVYL